jgi:hypothetical protein
VFQDQRERWKRFRDWQEDNRELFNDQAEFALFVEQDKKRREEEDPGWRAEREKVAKTQRLEWLASEYQTRTGQTDVDPEDEGFLAFVEEKRQQELKNGFASSANTEEEYTQALRNRFEQDKAVRYHNFFYWLREDHGRGKFPAHIDEAKRRLARHGLTRAFHFDEDPKRQDKVTTWIECFNFECSWHDKYTRSVKSLKPRHDQAWKKLVHSVVLRPGETGVSSHYGICSTSPK